MSSLGVLEPGISIPPACMMCTDDGRRERVEPSYGDEYLHELLPHSEIHPLDAGHFAWEQAAEEYGRLIADWVGGGYRRVHARSNS